MCFYDLHVQMIRYFCSNLGDKREELKVLESLHSEGSVIRNGAVDRTKRGRVRATASPHKRQY